MYSALFKLNILSEISRDVAQVFFATVFIGAVFGGRVDWIMAGVGLSLSVLFWLVSLYLSKE